MAAKGTLSTADMVPSIAIRAISLELVVAASNSKKKVRIIRAINMVAINPQLVKALSWHAGNMGMIKVAIPVANMRAKNIWLFLISIAL